MNESCARVDHADQKTLEIDLEHFTTLFAQAVKGDLSHEEEDDVVDIASIAMNAQELDVETRDMFQSAFLILSKKNKKFMNLSGYRRSRRKR
jgi:hypothetical protein